MHFLHIDPSKNNTSDLDKYIQEDKNIFVLFYMEGCGPCNATRPEWKKIKDNHDSSSYGDDFVVADVNQECLKDIQSISPDVPGFPTMIYITDKGKTMENYEDSGISKKDRSVESFIEWINNKSGNSNKSKSNKNKSHKSHSQKGGTKKRSRKIRNKKKSKKRHKWSLKYKRSINCKHPKGFSQKQYCKYGRKK